MQNGCQTLNAQTEWQMKKNKYAKTLSLALYGIPCSDVYIPYILMYRICRSWNYLYLQKLEGTQWQEMKEKRMIPVMTGVIGTYLKRCLTAFSVLLNVLLGGANNQTFSARNYEWQKQKRFNIVFLIDLVIGKGHCLECWVYWKVRRKW